MKEKKENNKENIGSCGTTLVLEIKKRRGREVFILISRQVHDIRFVDVTLMQSALIHIHTVKESKRIKSHVEILLKLILDCLPDSSIFIYLPTVTITYFHFLFLLA